MSGAAPRIAYGAQWVLPVSTPPVLDGAVVVQDGRIVQVTAAADVRSGEVGVDRFIDFGSAFLLPGLVNAHSHLELTMLRGMLEGLSFDRWLALLTAARAELFDDRELYVASVAGIREGLLAGVTTYGDATASGAPMQALVDCGVRGTAYLELFGPDPARCADAMDMLRRGVDRLRTHENSRVRVGVSPHAPYTVSSALFTACARYAAAERLPVTVHVAESRAEVEFVQSGTGAFAERLHARGIRTDARHRSPVALLEQSGLLDVAPLLVHAIHVDDADLAAIAKAGAPVVHCPVSNAKLGQGIAPLRAMVAAGIAVGLGSDSVASNNAMDILGEARQAVLLASLNTAGTLPSVDAARALALATVGGAQALGLEQEIGTLNVGKAADIAVFDFDVRRFGPVHDPSVALVHTLAGRAAARDVLVAGNPLVRDGMLVHEDQGDVHATMQSMANRLATWQSRSR